MANTLKTFKKHKLKKKNKMVNRYLKKNINLTKKIKEIKITAKVIYCISYLLLHNNIFPN